MDQRPATGAPPERRAAERLAALWEMPSPATRPLDAAALRELAMALLDAASAIEAEGRPAAGSGGARR